MATTRAGRSPRRTDALSRERIVAAAVEVLDAVGESGLTFKVLTERLATGSGAIYWHVANKAELLAAATDAVIGTVLTAEPTGPAAAAPQDRIRALALSLFDAIAEHPWIAGQLADRSAQATALRIIESIGQQVVALGVPKADWFTVTSVLVQYVLGAAAQNAANARALKPDVGRAEFLDAAANTWAQLDPDDYPFVRTVASQMRGHNDHAQFLAGVDIVLTGITTRHSS